MSLRRPRTHVTPPVGNSVTGKWAEAGKNLLIAMLALMLVAAAGTMFVLFVILRRVMIMVWLPVERAVSLVLYAIVAAFVTLFEQLIGFVVVGALVGGAIYMALEYSPKLKNTVNNFTTVIQRGAKNLTGFDLKIPTLHETMDILTSKGPKDNPNPLHPQVIEGQVRELERIKDIQMPTMPDLHMLDLNLPNIQMPNIPSPAALNQVVSNKAIPKELEPLLGVVMPPQMLAGFKMLADSGALQKGAEVALPLLQRGLYSQDANLSATSLQVLAGMQSPESKKVLMQYQQLITKALNDAARTGH